MISDLGLDPEDQISEDEQIIIEQLPYIYEKEIWFPLVESLSFITDEDITILDQHYEINTLKDLANLPHLSEPCKALLLIIGSKTINTSNAIWIRQMMVSRDDTKYQWRMRGKSESLQAGLIAERDPGENNIIDFGSAYITGSTKKHRWIIGDHQIKAGYGLNLWGGFPKQKGFETINILHRHGKGLLAYRSSHESWAFRGIGVSTLTDFGQWTVSAGTNFHDGYTDETGIHLSHTGYHDTDLSVSRKNQIKEATFAGMWTASRSTSYFGVVSSYGKWETQSTVESTYSVSVFGERRLSDSGKLFSEVCKINETIGMMSGVIFKQKGLSYIFSARYYPNGYTGLRSNPVAEWSGVPHGENGLYQGLKLSAGKIKITAFGDWFSEVNTAPRFGYENGIRADWKKNQTELRFQWKAEDKSAEDGGNWTETNPSSIKRETIKIWIKRKWENGWNLKGQWVATASCGEKGYGTEVQTGYKQQWLSIWAQSVITKVEGYPSRIYIWNLNLPGEMMSRMYAKTGVSLSGKVMIDRPRYCFGIRFSMQSTESFTLDLYDYALMVEANL